MFNLQKSFELKSALITKGCKIASHTSFSEGVALKKIHLYSHSPEAADHSITEDILLPNDVISRVRFRTTSPFILELCGKEYQIRNSLTEETVPVACISSPDFSSTLSNGVTTSQVCSHLGCDLIGVTPSNYCFYFQKGTQCRFCEILPTYKTQVEYPKSFKSIDITVEAIATAIAKNSHLRFLAITTGNFKSYDAVFDYYAELGQKLQKIPNFSRLEQVLATLMPPNDFKKLASLKESGYTKIYFPLEVYEERQFQITCPGKAEYGYDKIMKALDESLKIFGAGNVYTNFVYGIQSLNETLQAESYDAKKENELSIQAVEAMLSKGIIPAFTIYHYGGFNSIGDLQLDSASTTSFFKQWGKLVRESGIVAKNESSVIFGPLTLSNTLFNDGFRLAKEEN